MKKVLFIISLSLFITVPLNAQTTIFDNLNANPLTNKAITWTSSNYGSGFGHRIINDDPGGQTLLNFQGRHNTGTWSNIMSLTSNGKVGIGTTSPNKSLEIKGGNGIGIRLFNDTANTWDILNTQYGKLDFVRGGNNTFMRIDQLGNVGIGTTSPQYKLDVLGDIHFKNSSYLRTKNSNNLTTRVHGINSSNIEYIGAVDQNVSGTVIGTTSDYLNLRTNSISALYIDSNQNVGIGTTTPNARLHSYESTALGATLGDFQILSRISGKSGSVIMENNWLLRDAAGSNWLSARFHNGLSVDSSFLTPGVDTKTWWERDPLSGSQFWGNTSETQMALVGGNLGIGTTNPNATLQIGDSNNTGGPTSEIEIKRLSLAPVTHSGSDWFFTTRDNTPYANLDIGYSINKILTLRHDGNVGIGTTIPDAKLTVKGKIHSEEVKVDLSVPGPDYVFESDYNLTPLEDLQNYITENKHLPNIPSAKEMEANGLELGVMNMKLLEKIEELTLYTINQEKRINNLEQDNDVFKTQEKRINLLEKLIILLLKTKE